jgi:hypothetical protein
LDLQTSAEARVIVPHVCAIEVQEIEHRGGPFHGRVLQWFDNEIPACGPDERWPGEVVGEETWVGGGGGGGGGRGRRRRRRGRRRGRRRRRKGKRKRRAQVLLDGVHGWRNELVERWK